MTWSTRCCATRADRNQATGLRLDSCLPVPLKILIASGIWPPDVGGPASHGPELGRFLAARGHEVRAVISAGRAGPEPAGFPLRSTNRERPLPIRLMTGATAVAGEARGAAVIYATGMYARSALASRLWRIPLVLKLVNDPAYERARSLGLFARSLEEFQTASPTPRLRALQALRRLTLSRAARIVIPSEYLARIARGWGVAAERISIIPNPAPKTDGLVSREEARRRLGVSGPTLVFAGRIVLQKNLPLAVAALRQVPRASLAVVGEGPELSALERAISDASVAERVSLVGALPRDSAMQWLRAADAAVLSSDWENFPHAAVEALAAGTPVIATSVGGVPEIVQHGVNGLLVPPGDVAALAAAMHTITADPQLLGRLREGAEASSGRFEQGQTFAAIEHELERAVLRS
jgi:glycosyltransferase involved in cell wall biosynthesis